MKRVYFKNLPTNVQQRLQKELDRHLLWVKDVLIFENGDRIEVEVKSNVENICRSFSFRVQ